jgi:hypothetical protein
VAGYMARRGIERFGLVAGLEGIATGSESHWDR